MPATTVTCTAREELFLGPVHTFTADHGEDTRGTTTETTYERTVEGWTRTTQKIGPATGYCWQETENVRTTFARVLDALAGSALEDVVDTECRFTTDDTRRRKALTVALAKHGLALAA